MNRGPVGTPPPAEPSRRHPTSPEEPTTPADDYDPVVDEAKRWENLAQKDYQAFIGEDGLLNELVYQCKRAKPHGQRSQSIASPARCSRDQPPYATQGTTSTRSPSRR